MVLHDVLMNLVLASWYDLSASAVREDKCVHKLKARIMKKRFLEENNNSIFFSFLELDICGVVEEQGE